MELAKEPAPRIDGYGSGGDMGSTHGVSEGGASAHAERGSGGLRDEQSILDQTMDSHFTYIQVRVRIESPLSFHHRLTGTHGPIVI